MKRGGFSLIEVIAVSALMIVVMGAVFQVFWGVNDTAELAEVMALAHDEARRSIQIMGRELRQAAFASFSALPANELHFRIPVFEPEPSPGEEMVIARDIADANRDGIGESQLVLIRGGDVEVLANGLVSRAENDTTDPGIWFERAGSCIRVQVCAGQKSRNGRLLDASLTLTIAPRN